MLKKTLSGLLFVGVFCCGSIFAAPAAGSESTNTYSYSNTQEVADGCSLNGSCNSCGAPRYDSRNSCNSCERRHNDCDSCDKCCDWQLFGYADWLYWRHHSASLHVVTFNENDSYILNGDCCCFEPEFDHGFRVGVGFKSCSCWDVTFEYTYWNHDQSLTCTDEYGQMLTDRTHPEACTQAYYAHADYEVTLHIGDITVGANFKPCGDIVIRPFIGARVALLDQDLDTVYANEVDPYPSITPITPIVIDTVAEEVDMISYGIVGGVDMTIPVGCGFGVFGRFAGYGAYGDFNVKYISGCEEEPECSIIYSCDCDRMVGMLQLQAGVQWEWTFCECFNVKLAAGWETQAWFNVEDFVQFVNGTSDTAVIARTNQCFGLEGAFVRVGIGF